ncbi:uncharacterized protein [Lepeophtheirus salmonis]|uniref:uncharacterized protein isoform X2 n=1 Tax=Lepeophtheirus salmonis TaxID=72036 RepID=UPI001AEB1623|nr:A disintegrin and metalloproteinase with thrombospondin motifs adt-1-like isoform X2 [Lepeophtheirus salmonis]
MGLGKWTALSITLVILSISSTLADSRKQDKVTLTIAVYRDQAYVDYFNSVNNLDDLEALKIHSSAMKYFLGSDSLEPQIDVQFIIRDTLFTFEEYGISTDTFLTIFNDFHNTEMKSSSAKWDHAILLTGNGSKPEGLTNFGGFCNVNTSGTVVKAESLHITPLMGVRYIARNMGMEWDVQSTDNYIMKQELGPGISGWSKKSQTFWDKLSNNKECFKRDLTVEFNLLNYLPGFRTDLNQQCQAALGTAFTYRTNESSSPCQELICGNSTTKETTTVASLPGIRCDKFKYCWRGDCRSLTNILHEINEKLVDTTTQPLPGPTLIQAILKIFIKITRFINFFYNRS